VSADHHENTTRIIKFRIRVPFLLIGGIEGGVAGIKDFLRYERLQCGRLPLPGSINSISNRIYFRFGDEVGRIVGNGPIPGFANVAIAKAAITASLDIATSW
jgi:hypothetical protein